MLEIFVLDPERIFAGQYSNSELHNRQFRKETGKGGIFLWRNCRGKNVKACAFFAGHLVSNSLGKKPEGMQSWALLRRAVLFRIQIGIFGLPQRGEGGQKQNKFTCPLPVTHTHILVVVEHFVDSSLFFVAPVIPPGGPR